jgi:CheY-like chemotaxis protein
MFADILPLVDGYEVARRLRQHHPSIEIIAVTVIDGSRALAGSRRARIAACGCRCS